VNARSLILLIPEKGLLINKINKYMSQREYRIVIKRELSKLNKKIDEKIMWGQSYKAEARRHEE